MASDNSSSAGGGIGFFGLLGVVFITLKLCGVIDWSWWIVLAPLWGGFLFFAAIICLCLVIAAWLAIREQGGIGRRW